MARHAADDLNNTSQGKEFDAEVSLKREFEEQPTWLRTGCALLRVKVMTKSPVNIGQVTWLLPNSIQCFNCWIPVRPTKWQGSFQATVLSSVGWGYNSTCSQTTAQNMRKSSKFSVGFWRSELWRGDGGYSRFHVKRELVRMFCWNFTELIKLLFKSHDFDVLTSTPWSNKGSMSKLESPHEPLRLWYELLLWQIRAEKDMLYI